MLRGSLKFKDLTQNNFLGLWLVRNVTEIFCKNQTIASIRNLPFLEVYSTIEDFLAAYCLAITYVTFFFKKNHI